MTANLKVIVIPPDDPPYVSLVDQSDEHAFQKIIGGYFEVLPIGEGLLWVNEEGKRMGLAPNERATLLAQHRLAHGDFIRGYAILTGGATDPDNLVDVKPELIERMVP